MFKTKKEALISARKVLKKGTVYPMKIILQSYGRGKNKTYNFRFAIKEVWKPSQTSSGYYRKNKFGYETLKFKYEPKNKIAPKWSVNYYNSSSGSGRLLGRFRSRINAKLFARKYMKTN
jgi:hypothetical protein